MFPPKEMTVIITFASEVSVRHDFIKTFRDSGSGSHINTMACVQHSRTICQTVFEPKHGIMVLQVDMHCLVWSPVQYAYSLQGFFLFVLHLFCLILSDYACCKCGVFLYIDCRVRSLNSSKFDNEG